MIHKIELVLFPEEVNLDSRKLELASQILKTHPNKIKAIRILKRSIDARSKKVLYRLTAEVFVDENPPKQKNIKEIFFFDKDVSKSEHHPNLSSWREWTVRWRHEVVIELLVARGTIPERCFESAGCLMVLVVVSRSLPRK